MWFYKAVFLPFYSDLLVLPRERLLVLPALCNWSPRVFDPSLLFRLHRRHVVLKGKYYTETLLMEIRK